jgi:hypothetical protein
MTDASLQFQEGLQRIYDLAEDLAKQNGYILTSIQLDGNKPVGATEYHIIELSVGAHSVSEKLHREEIEDYPDRVASQLTRAKIGSAIERLTMMVKG